MQEGFDFDSRQTIGEIVRGGARDEQEKELARVSSGIAAHILDFFRVRGVGAEFRVSNLNDYVCMKTGGHVAPGSSDRVMRDLRKRRLLDYELVSRSKSLYRVKGVQ